MGASQLGGGLCNDADHLGELDSNQFGLLHGADTWQCCKAHNGETGSTDNSFTSLAIGNGYIYRCSDDRSLVYTGEPNSEATYSITLTRANDDSPLHGFNLVGNPYPTPLPFVRDHYSLNPDGSWTAHTDGNGILEVGQAVLVYTANGETLTLSPTGIVSGAKGSLPPLPKGLRLNDGSTGSPQDNEDSQFSTLNSQFAQWNGDQLVITGEGILTAYDALGRELFREKVSTYQHINVSTFPQAGVYVLRLNGQSQKIIIR